MFSKKLGEREKEGASFLQAGRCGASCSWAGKGGLQEAEDMEEKRKKVSHIHMIPAPVSGKVAKCAK